jgi:hypothetical protein
MQLNDIENVLSGSRYFIIIGVAKIEGFAKRQADDRDL